MKQAIPAGLEKSPAMQLIVSQGWDFTGPSGGQMSISKCPFCHKDGGKFYVAVSEDLEADKRDGLYFCHKCQITGNLRKLQEHLGLRVAGVDSRKDWAGGKSDKPDALPDPDVCHVTLLGDADALDYLLNVRGFSREIIEKQKLGLKEKVYFRKSGETRALVIPYLSAEGNVTFAKYRTIPPAEKDFVSPAGWEAGLYNAPALHDECKEIIMVEGECDAISLLSHGVENVVGVPGAGVKKAAWIEALDRINPKVYILYDSDKSGIKGAQELASRIGLDRCLKITLPSGIKDINEFFTKGGTTEGFEDLKKRAVLFDVTGVMSSANVLDEIEDELSGKTELAPSYTSSWDDFNRLVAFENGDIIDVVAPGKIGKTTWGLNLIDDMVDRYGEDGLVVCLEMPQRRIAKKWICKVTGFEDIIVAPHSPEAEKKLVNYKAAIQKAREIQKMRTADLYFAYPQQIKEPEDVFKLIRDCIRRYGVKWIMFDNLQLLCDTTLKHQGHRTVHLSQISKGFQKLAKDFAEMGVKLIRIVQPKQIDKDSVVTSRDVDGSSQIEKDCDAQVLLWRQSLAVKKISAYEAESKVNEEEEEIFSPKMKCTVSLSRYSGGGFCWMKFDGARSRVTTWTEEKPQALQQNYNGILPQEKPQMVSLPTESI